MFGADLQVLPNVPPTLTKELVLCRRVCLRPLALALRLHPDNSLVGELLLEQRLPVNVNVILLLVKVVVLRELMVERGAI